MPSISRRDMLAGTSAAVAIALSAVQSSAQGGAPGSLKGKTFLVTG